MTMITHASLARDIEDFLMFKRALGYPYRRGELMLISFQRFIERHVDSRSRFALEVEIERWLGRAGERKPVTIGLELGVIRQLCLFRRRRAPDSVVPEHAMAPVVESTFSPYIFSQDEIHRILEETKTYRHRTMSATMQRTLILILYCTGLRLGEAVRLQMADVDLERRTFWIRESKGRHRIVPFRADLAREILHYLAQRHGCRNAPDEDEDRRGALFVRSTGAPLTVNTASCAITRILRKIGIKPQQGRVGPRPYELRHAFAVHRLTDWYRTGVDIQAKLPWLSAYMGHVDVLGTEAYLAATPDLSSSPVSAFTGVCDKPARMADATAKRPIVQSRGIILPRPLATHVRCQRAHGTLLS